MLESCLEAKAKVSDLFSVRDEAGLDGVEDVHLTVLLVGVGDAIVVVLFFVVDLDFVTGSFNLVGRRRRRSQVGRRRRRPGRR